MRTQLLRFHGLGLTKGRFNAIAFYLDIAGMFVAWRMVSDSPVTGLTGAV
jgi:hypothetical protein